MLANEFNRMPTHPGALETSPQWMEEITFKAMDVDWVDLSEKQSQWMQKWDTEIKDTGKDVN
jgi:iron(III) transport system substrate-binding protein